MSPRGFFCTTFHNNRVIYYFPIKVDVRLGLNGFILKIYLTHKIWSLINILKYPSIPLAISSSPIWIRVFFPNGFSFLDLTYPWCLSLHSWYKKLFSTFPSNTIPTTQVVDRRTVRFLNTSIICCQEWYQNNHEVVGIREVLWSEQKEPLMLESQ